MPQLFVTVWQEFSLKKLRGGLLLVVGYLLSPLSWWNDLIFNLPIAYGIGYLCHLLDANLLLPGMIAGYWLSNILGILLMQAGVLDVVKDPSGTRNWRKELLTGVFSSTVYTLLILALVQLKILGLPEIFATDTVFNLPSFLPGR
ncbi:hypothetical protein BST81_17020 [Leptolyngbya sp. 'hensonii']|nr:hypothetical protein BST81_17020 [Leptolyngbya sp. 'hensonii']